MPKSPKKQGAIRIDTPAKVTLRLEVLERLPNGYHRVRIALAPISLYDTLHFRVEPGEGVSLEMDGGPLFCPESENLAVRAARAFLAELGQTHRIHLRLS